MQEQKTGVENWEQVYVWTAKASRQRMKCPLAKVWWTGTEHTLTRSVGLGDNVLSNTTGTCMLDRRQLPRCLGGSSTKTDPWWLLCHTAMWLSIWKHTHVSQMAGDLQKKFNATRGPWTYMCSWCLDLVQWPSTWWSAEVWWPHLSSETSLLTKMAGGG